MSGSFTTRAARPEDEAQVVELWHQCSLVAPYNDPNIDFRFAIAGSCSAVWVAEDTAHNVVGSVMVGHDGHRGWLYYIASSPRMRSRGVGRAMVDAGENWLRERKVAKVQLIVRPTNTAVVQFYEHLGFEDMPRVLMSKWLSSNT